MNNFQYDEKRKPEREVRCRELVIFKILGIFWTFYKIFWNFFFFGVFWNFSGCFFELFFGGMFLEEIFGGIFWEDFLEELFDRNIRIDLFVKILVFVKILSDNFNLKKCESKLHRT